MGDDPPEAACGLPLVTGTGEEHIGRYRGVAEAGVQTAIERLPALDESSIEAFAPVIDAFSR